MIRIRGASDDIIQIEGDITEEFSYEAAREPQDGDLLAFSDGTVLRVQYGDIWRITPVARGTADLDIEQTTEDSDGHTDTATLSGDIRWVVHGIDIAQRRPEAASSGQKPVDLSDSAKALVAKHEAIAAKYPASEVTWVPNNGDYDHRLIQQGLLHSVVCTRKTPAEAAEWLTTVRPPGTSYGRWEPDKGVEAVTCGRFGTHRHVTVVC